MQRCHCCARLWRGASTSVVALLPRLGFEGTNTVYNNRTRDQRAFWGPIAGRAKAVLSALLKQTIHFLGASRSKDDCRPKSWASDTQRGVEHKFYA